MTRVPRWEPLVALAAPHAGREREAVDVLVRSLVGSAWSGAGRPPSILNNDGVPLQLCISSSAERVGVRLIGDPCSGLEAGERFTASVALAERLMERTEAAELAPWVRTTIAKTLPQAEADRALLPNGALWLAAAVDRTLGMALYTTLAWGDPDEASRWQRVHAWLAAVLPREQVASRSLAALAERCVPASAGVEGSGPDDARAKLYVRLRRAASFDQLGLEGFTDPGVLRFVELALAGRSLPLEGLMLAVGFSLATGELADVKVDLCGHCIPRPPAAWQELVTQLCAATGVRSLGIEPALTEHDVEVAFIGLGRARSGKLRLNLYLKSKAPSP